VGRRLGQHFLTDPHILDRIVEAAEPDPRDVVIEIGPGRGTLTYRLAPRVGQVIAVEKDRRLVETLGSGTREAGRVGPDNVLVVRGDALAVDWVGLVAEAALPACRFPLPGFKVVGNIPYYISTPLIERALALASCRLVVFLVQREVADRLAAPPGSKTYGALSAGVQAQAAVERLFAVRRGAFQPPPKVDSALVRLRPLANPLVDPAEHAAWRRFLAGVFSQRRKQLGRSLRGLWEQPREVIAALLADLGIDAAGRPESLAPAELVRLFRGMGRLQRPPAAGHR
jgi:16S rRNA (adenine1518-N6/adenine1519-N6)-dimethyltransferase